MMKFSRKSLVGLAVGAGLLAAAPVVTADHRSNSDRDNGGRYDRGGFDHGGRDFRDRDLDVVGLTDGGLKLIVFEDDRPGYVRRLGNVTGLTGDERLVGIDFRVQDSKLYGVGDAGGIYTLDSRARASKVSQLTVALQGNSFGVDFNPAANALRVVSDAGQNLRHPFANTPPGPTATDGTLTYPATATTPATTASGVTGAAYTNNDADPNTSTTLFDVDSMLDQIDLQSPANSGLLATTGKLGVDTDATIGFDIYSTIRNGTTVDLRGLAALNVDGRSRFYRIDLLQGRAHFVGTFPSRYKVDGIAIPLDQL